MSKGTKVTTVRIRPLLLARIKAYLSKRAKNPTALPWSLTDFISHACNDALKKRARSSKSRKPKEELIDLANLVDGSDYFTPSNTPIVWGEQPT